MSSGRAQQGSLYKLAILGDGGVGKTALTIQLCLNQFVETYDPTIEDSYRKRIVLDGQPTTLEVLDTAGQEEYTALRDQWIRDGEGFLLVYSITERNAFSRIKHYYNQILRVKDGEPFGAVLVGNKCDRTEDRAVSVPEGEQLAKSLGIPFYETSAKLNINAEIAFLTAARLTRDTRNAEYDHELMNGNSLTPPAAEGVAIVSSESATAPSTGADPIGAAGTTATATAAVAAGAPAPGAATAAPATVATEQGGPQTKTEPAQVKSAAKESRTEAEDGKGRRRRRRGHGKSDASKKCVVM